MDAVTAERLDRQWLADRRPRTAGDVVRHLLAVQAQDLVGARLALRSRSSGLSASDVDAALDRGELVVTWLGRGTLHLVAAEDYHWLRALTAHRTLTANRRRLAQEGVSAEHSALGVATVVEQIERHGPRTRAQLREALDAAGVPTAGQALVHVLMAASLAGHVVRGPTAGTEQAYVLVSEHLPAPGPLDRDAAPARLAERYLAAHSPATDVDLATWAGIPLGEARRGLAAAATPPPVVPGPVPPRLLGPFDPVLHGWPDRSWLVGDAFRRLVTVNGIFRPTVLAGGRAVGTWTRGRGIVLDLFAEVSPADRAALDEDAADVTRFLTG